MSRYVVDLEANGLLDEATKIHCLVLKDRDTKKIYSYANQPGYEPIQAGLARAFGAEMLIGHNILCYDIPLIRKIAPSCDLWYQPELRDTLLMSRIRWPEISEIDASGKYPIPKHLYGEYSLEAFGHRLGMSKIEHEDWSEWSPAMQKRCERDVDLTDLLLDKIEEDPISPKCLQIEHDFQRYIHVQEQCGVPFDVEAAMALNTPLKKRKEDLISLLQKLIPPREVVMKTKVKHVPFNPGSRDQIIRFLCEKYGWEPSKFTDNGNPSLDDDVLESLSYPEAAHFREYFQVQKLLGMLSEGDKSWFRFVNDGRIYGRVVTTGTVTRRCTHSSPNLAQIPSVRAFLGKEVRALFRALDGYRMVGADAAGLELRMLSHYLSRYDGGAYAREVTQGDVHTANQRAVELATRDDAKTFIYALIYGGGDEVLGGIKSPMGSSIQQKAAGKHMRNLFRSKIPAYGKLVDEVRATLKERPSLIGIDGGKLYIRRDYSALNTLLQNAGSVAVKNATVIGWKEAKRRGVEHYPALHVHDEWQTMAKEADAHELGKIKVQAIRDSGEDLNLRCPLDGEYKVGKNWAETH